MQRRLRRCVRIGLCPWHVDRQQSDSHHHSGSKNNYHRHPNLYVHAFRFCRRADEVINTPPTCHVPLHYTPGSYAGAIVCSGGADNNYNFAYVNGTLTIIAQTATYYSVAGYDGWILESSRLSSKGGSLNSTATLFYIGDDAAKKQYRGVLSFATHPLPDNATITSTNLKLRYNGMTTGYISPTAMLTAFGGFRIDVKKGFFTSAPLATTDFQTAANQTVAATPTLISNAYTINLTAAKNNINKLASYQSGLTQIRVRFNLGDNNNTVANYMKFFSGNYATVSYRPTLIVTYYVTP